MSGFAESPVIIGHRGAAGLEPENTLPSFRAAVALGVQAVELDVHVCDGELIVIHDPTLERTTNGSGEVSSSIRLQMRLRDPPTIQHPALRIASWIWIDSEAY